MKKIELNGFSRWEYFVQDGSEVADRTLAVIKVLDGGLFGDLVLAQIGESEFFFCPGSTLTGSDERAYADAAEAAMDELLRIPPDFSHISFEEEGGLVTMGDGLFGVLLPGEEGFAATLNARGGILEACERHQVLGFLVLKE